MMVRRFDPAELRACIGYGFGVLVTDLDHPHGCEEALHTDIHRFGFGLFWGIDRTYIRVMHMTVTPTATAPTTDPAGTADVTGTANTAGVTPSAAGIGTPADVAVLVARLAQVADQLAATIQAHSTSDDRGGRVGMPTAGAILAATDRLTATVVAVLGSVSHRGVVADEGISAAAWLRTFAARTAADERMLANTVDRLADMPTVWALFCSGTCREPATRSG